MRKKMVKRNEKYETLIPSRAKGYTFLHAIKKHRFHIIYNYLQPHFMGYIIVAPFTTARYTERGFTCVDKTT